MWQLLFYRLKDNTVDSWVAWIYASTICLLGCLVDGHRSGTDSVSPCTLRTCKGPLSHGYCAAVALACLASGSCLFP